MACLMITIVSTLAVFFIMTVKMGHAQTQQCTKAPPIKQYFKYLVGTCYIQATLIKAKDNGVPPFRCASLIIRTGFGVLSGTILYEAIFRGSNKYRSGEETWHQVNRTLQNSQNNELAQAITVTTIRKRKIMELTSAIYRNELGYIFVICSLTEERKIKKLTGVFICTKKEKITACQLQEFMDEAENLGLDINNMAQVDQKKCPRV